MMTPDLSLDHDYTASPERVFDAWLDPASLARFMCPAPGAQVGRIDVDARVGGAFLITMGPPGALMPHTGVYTHIERPVRLAFTWCSPMAGEGSEVSLRFHRLAGGGTRLHLRHTGLPSERARSAHASGWGHILSALGTSPVSDPTPSTRPS